MSTPPRLTVVVAATWTAEAVARTVGSIVGAVGGDDAEVIVVSPAGRIEPTVLPGPTRWLIAPAGSGVPELRRVGAEAARGAVVAFVEDACVVGPDWPRAVASAFNNPAVVAATGPVVQRAGASATDWAVYFAEYAPFARLLSGRLAGINFAVRREALDLSRPIREHEADRSLLGRIACVDGAMVRHVRRYGFAEAVADRRRFGREYGRERWETAPSRTSTKPHGTRPRVGGGDQEEATGSPRVSTPDGARPPTLTLPRDGGGNRRGKAIASIRTFLVPSPFAGKG